MKNVIKMFIVILLIVLESNTVKADQYLHLDESTREKALQILLLEKEVISYCRTCTNSSKETILLSTVKVEEHWGSFLALNILGKGEKSKNVCEFVDLAYLFLKRGKKAVAMAEIMQLTDLIDTNKLFEDSFNWIERSAKYWKPEKDMREEKFLLKLNTQRIKYVIGESYYYQDSTEVRHYLVPEIYDSGKVYVGEFPDMEYIENEYGGVEMFYEVAESLHYDQQMHLSYEEINSLTLPFSSNLKLEIKQGIIRNRSDSYQLFFPYKGIRAEVGNNDWGMFSYYTTEGGVPKEFVLSHLEFMYKDCFKTTTFVITNIGIFPRDQYSVR
jgi:hypothetical protein